MEYRPSFSTRIGPDTIVLIGCDTGGTFTDFVMFDPRSPERGLRQLKLSSTPDDPSRAVLEGVAILSEGALVEEVNHATTVATNTLLESTGARVAFLTTEGFADLLWLGRGDRADLYSLHPSRTAPPLCREDVYELSERMNAAGETVRSLDQGQLDSVLSQLSQVEVEAVAVCFLHAALNPKHEREVLKAASALGKPVFCSHQISSTPGEYERGMSCLLAAYLAPKVTEYITNLGDKVGSSRLWILHSAGGRLTPEEATEQPHRLALSGPAAGLRGALALAQLCEQPAKLLTLDMGGTSTDVALCDQELPYVWQMDIEGYPLTAPSLDIHTIGAGGGSLAYLDGGGFLRVGPRSAGADPGPACYGRGGEQATVTDALCWAGYLPSTLGDQGLALDRSASERVLNRLAEELELELAQTALGVLELSVAHLSQAVRKVSTGQGQDPQNFTLFPFGGAGPLLACAVAEALNMQRILVPVSAGVLSAWGALSAPWEREWSAMVAPAARGDLAQVEKLASELEEQARRETGGELGEVSHLYLRRYLGQGEGLSSAPGTDFHQLHQRRYGFQREDTPVEHLQVKVRARRAQVCLGVQSEGTDPIKVAEKRHLRTASGELEVPVYRGQLAPGEVLPGPFLYFGHSSTLWVSALWKARGLLEGNLLLERA